MRLSHQLVRAWERRGIVACMLWPLSCLYGLLVRARTSLYAHHRLSSARAPVPVIVVGNVVAGGAGKTPVVIALVQHLQSKGLQPGVLSRGYGRSSTHCTEVLPGSPLADTGDEPALIRRKTQAPVFVAPRRWDAALALLSRYPRTQVLICDDGLQHLALQRDMEICVFDNRGTGNGWLLPAGPLREPWPRRTDLVLHSGSRPAFAGLTARRALADHAVRADGSTVPLTQLQGTPLLALAAIAQPEAFFDMLRAAGLALQTTLALPDHYDFKDWAAPADLCELTWVCTEKDAVKLWRTYPQALAVPLEFMPEPAFFDAIDLRLNAIMSLPPFSERLNGQQTS